MGISKWLKANVPEKCIALKADSIFTLRQAAASGLGLTPLPCYLGDSTPELERVPSDALADMKTGLWILSHADLRHTARVRAFTSFAAKELLEAYTTVCR